MKLVTYSVGNSSPQLGVCTNGHVLNLSTSSDEALPDDMLSFLKMGQAGLDIVHSLLEDGKHGILESDIKLLASYKQSLKDCGNWA